MSNEKPDDASHWINKLEDPSAAEPWTGKNAAWEKLYSRLHEKPRRKIPVWHWAAAVCLLLILYMPVRQAIRGRGGVKREGQAATDRGWSMKTGGQATTYGDRAVKTENRTLTAKSPGEHTMTIGTQTAMGRRPATVAAKRRGAGKGKPVTKEEIKPATWATATVPPNTFPHLDTMVVAGLVTPPAKKKLRVVHINELSDPAGESGNLVAANPSTTGDNGRRWTSVPIPERPVGNTRGFTGNMNTGRNFFHFGRPRTQVDPSSMASTDNTSYESVKIKLSPQN